MTTSTDFALATFAACLAELTDAFARGGLSPAEIRAALERRLRAHGGPIPPVPFDPARAPDGRTVRIELLSDEGGGDAG